MRTKISLLILLATSVFYYSFGQKALTTEEAKKKIKEYSYKQVFSQIPLEKFVDNNKVPKHITALNKAGYIGLVSAGKAKPGMSEVKVLKKGQPFLLRDEKESLYFDLAHVEIKILSIAKPKPGTKGNPVCYVEYEERVTTNDLCETWKPHCIKTANYTAQAKFIKKPGGWNCEEVEY